MRRRGTTLSGAIPGAASELEAAAAPVILIAINAPAGLLCRAVVGGPAVVWVVVALLARRSNNENADERPGNAGAEAVHCNGRERYDIPVRLVEYVDGWVNRLIY